jgi:hypothetical protein
VLKRYVFVCLFLLASVARGAGAYKCTVKGGSNLTEAGRLDATASASAYVGAEFTLDRGTGRMSGALTNHGASGKPQVLDPGSTEQAYKAVTLFKPFTSVDLIYVKEFADSPIKPFMFITGENVLTGTCVHY